MATKPMTARQALAKAQTLWRNAAVDARPNAKSPCARCVVGHIDLGMFFMVEGSGATFEEAFVAAAGKTKTSLG